MFSPIYRWLSWSGVGALCIASFAIMFLVSARESAIMDELAHIPAGYGYVRHLDFRLNPEHPPLVKALAGLPLLLLGPNFPTDRKAWRSDVNGQWEMGTEFLYRSGNDADRIIRAARIGPILLTILLVILIYLWSRELMGHAWALIPAAFFALSPNVLAHGHYVTTDIAAAFGVVFATRYYLKYLFHPSRKTLFKAGLAFGVAMIAKFSTALLVPYFALLAAAFFAVDTRALWQREGAARRVKRIVRLALRHAAGLAAVFAIGFLAIVYPAYALFTANYPQAKQTADTEFILGSFAGGPPGDGIACNPARCIAELDIRMAKNPVTRPLAEYFLGLLMVLQRAAGGNTNYFLGEVSAAGWHYYFPVVYALKEPLPILLIVLAAFITSMWIIARNVLRYKSKVIGQFFDYLTTHFHEFAMIAFVFFYWAWSIRSPLNIGFRHLLPTLPFMYMLAAGFWKRRMSVPHMPKSEPFFRSLVSGARTLLISSAQYVLLFFLLSWFFIETLIASPHYLSYFNELGGGTWGGYRYVTDSNYDWGQDLLRLKQFVAEHPGIKKIGVDYFGGGNPGYYLGEKNQNWWSARGNPRDAGIEWLAVSVNTLQGAMQKLHPGEQRKPEDEYRWLAELRPAKPGMGNVPEPDFRVGTSIFVYKL